MSSAKPLAPSVRALHHEIVALAVKWADLTRRVKAAKAGRSSNSCERRKVDRDGFLFGTPCFKERVEPDGEQTDPATWCSGCKAGREQHLLYRQLVPELQGVNRRLRMRALDLATLRGEWPAGRPVDGNGTRGSR